MSGLLSINRRPPPWMLWSWAARDLTLTSRTGQAGTLVRATRNAWVQDANGIYHEAVDRAPLFATYYDAAALAHKFGGLALHAGGQEIGTRSTDISNAAFAWNNSGRFTFSDAPSRLGGHVAKRAVNDNTSASTGRTLSIGTPGAVARTAWMIVENVDATVCDIGLLSATDVFVSGVRATLTFATGAIDLAAGAGIIGARRIAANTWLVFAGRVCVAGHAMSGIYYLTGTAQNDKTVIPHAAGVTDAAYPLVIATAGAALTRNADELSWPLNVLPAQLAATGFTAYDAFFVERFPSGATMDCVMYGENDVGGSNALLVSMDTSLSRMAARWNTPGGNVSSTVAPASFSTLYVPGAFVERAVQITSAGSATALLRINGGAVGAGTPTAAIGFPTAWDVSKIVFADEVTADRKGHRLATAGGLAIGIRSLEDMAEICA